MKRIAAIELHNFLAFYGTDNRIILPKGENLLLYGENGSGKSSLCRALEVFFDAKSSPDFDVKYRNLWATRADANPSIIVDFLNAHHTPPIETVEFPSKVASVWIEESRLASGFLTYRDILKTHFLEEHRQNLFDLVVNEILHGYKSPISGKVLSEEWADFEEVYSQFLMTDWGDPLSTRADEFGEEKKVMDIISDLVADFGEVSQSFDDSLVSVLQGLNSKTNEFLTFFDQNISVELVIGDHLDPLENPEQGTMLSYHNLSDDIDLLKKLRDRAIDSDVQKGAKTLLQNLTLKKPLLTAEVHYFGRFIPEHQTFLNEARLTSLAICIFLAAIRLKPDPQDGCKVLFLDDVLIGLDGGNRLPLLRILKEHFQDFQVLISTYDRHWFEISKRFVDKLGGDFEWECGEIYSKEVKNGASSLTKPVYHKSESNLASAFYHFKNTNRPDYPASVNYLRKALEEMIRGGVPVKELKESTGETNQKTLQPLLDITNSFFDRLHIPTITVEHLSDKLRTLLNPLSHFEIDNPIYRNEVREIFELVENLSHQFTVINKTLKEVLPRGPWIQIRFPISPNEIGVYRIELKKELYALRGTLSDCTCQVIENYIMTNGKDGKKSSLTKSYSGLKDAYDQIFNFCKTGKYPSLVPCPDYLDALFVEENGSIVPIKSKI